MPVLVRREAPASPHLPLPQVQRSAEKMLAELRISSAELSVLLTDDTTIHRLNFEHRGKNQATDVLAFPLMDPDDEALQTLENGALGDVVISLDTAQRQAGRAGRELLAEVRALLAHGILHLLGYDHQDDVQEREMNSLADRLVEASERRSTRNVKSPQ
jgi:probable rRNA maturation factor